jgi:hypothetical protein
MLQGRKSVRHGKECSFLLMATWGVATQAQYQAASLLQGRKCKRVQMLSDLCPVQFRACVERDCEHFQQDLVGEFVVTVTLRGEYHTVGILKVLRSRCYVISDRVIEGSSRSNRHFMSIHRIESLLAFCPLQSTVLPSFPSPHSELQTTPLLNATFLPYLSNG